jgi:hypothetical protein
MNMIAETGNVNERCLGSPAVFAGERGHQGSTGVRLIPSP